MVRKKKVIVHLHLHPLELEDLRLGGGADGEMNGEKAKEALKEVQKSLEETSQQIETANTMAEELKKRVTNMKTYQEALSNVSNFVLTGLSAKESSIQQSIKEISSKITQFSNQIKSLKSEIKTIHQEIELLKKNISTVKNYEGKFLNAICNLYTVEKQECNLKQNS